MRNHIARRLGLAVLVMTPLLALIGMTGSASGAGPDPPGLNAKPEHGSNNGEDTDTLYNTWLERQYYHNPQSGENYWVSPSENYSQTGPDGPGYYATYGGNLIKLSPGYAQ